MIKKLLISAIAGTLMPLFFAASGNASYLGGDSHVQLKHIMASVQGKAGSMIPAIRPLTPIMTVPKADDVTFVCQRAPRAAEAVLRYFQKYPAPMLKGNKLDSKTLDKQFAKIASYVNRALGRAVISEVFIVDGGGPSMAKGGMARLPFARIQGCSRVLEEFEERLKALRKEAEAEQ